MGKGVLSDVLERKRLRDSLKNRGITAAKGVGARLVRGGRATRRGGGVTRKKGIKKRRENRLPGN